MRLSKALATSVIFFLASSAFADVNLASFGADPSGEHDSGPALQAALNSLGTAKGTTLFIPAGTFRIHTPVTRSFSDVSGIVIRGEGSASVLKIALDSSGRALQLQNLDSVLVENVTFAGSHPNGMSVDALHTLDFENCRQATVRHCDFYGVTTVRGGAHGAPPGAVVYALHSDLRIERSAFHACAGDWSVGTTPFDGTPVIDNDDWTGFSLSDTELTNRGTLNGVIYAGATSQPSSAWVRLRTPAPRQGLGAMGQREAVIRDVSMDDGAYYGVAVKNSQPGERPAAVSISGLNVNGFNSGQLDQGSGLFAAGVDDLRIEKSWFGNSQYASKFAIELLDVTNAVLDGVICDPARLMRKIRVAGQTNLTIRNSAFSLIEGTPATLNISGGGQNALSVPARVVTSNVSLRPEDVEQVLFVFQPVSVVLPSASAVNGRSYTIKNESGAPLTVGSGGGLIDGAPAKTLQPPHSAVTVTAANGNWYVVSQVSPTIPGQ